MKCPQRLQKLIYWMPQDSVLIDVGCDHAYLGIFALQEKRVSRVISIDRNEAPLRVAQRNALRAGVLDRMQLRCTDGLENIEIPPHSTLVMAGMGGKTIKEIVLRISLQKIETLILQPNRDAHEVRNYLFEQNWGVVDAQIFPQGKQHFLSWKSLFMSGVKEHTQWHWHDPFLSKNPSKEWKSMLQRRNVHLTKLKAASQGKLPPMILCEQKILEQYLL